MWLHELLKKIRAERGLSQFGCAKKLGFAASPWRSIELGHVTPNLRTLIRIGEFFGIKVILVCGRESYVLSLAPRRDGKEGALLTTIPDGCAAEPVKKLGA